MISQPETPTQSKRGGKAKAIFSLQTERQGQSRPTLGPPLQAIHHTTSPLALSRGGVGRITAPPACPGRAVVPVCGGNIRRQSSRLRPILEP
eukprot:3570477-Amphidinium_carterae.1